MTAGDMTESIAPRSDQMNAEDLLSGPRTFTITRVRVTSGDQPVHVYLAEFPDDRPFKPSKTVRRLMVVAWGAGSAAYVGKRLTLYRDPDVRFGGMDVGGIRVSHMSGLNGPLNVALAATRGRRIMYTVDPLPDGHTPPGPRGDRTDAMVAAFSALGVTVEDIERRIGRPRAGWSGADVDRMKDVYAALSSGKARREDEFPGPDPVVPAAMGRPVDLGGGPPHPVNRRQPGLDPDDEPPPEPDGEEPEPGEPVVWPDAAQPGSRG